jgi:hypothetical protein
MDRFSLVVLGSTLELATDAMPHDKYPRVAACAEIIRGYIGSPHSQDENQLRQAVNELADLAHQNRQFKISARLKDFARQFVGAYGKSDVA